MADVKFTGIRYEYNNVTIQIAEGDISVSKIRTSGITIGGAVDFDRIMNLQPGEIKVKDDVIDLRHNFTNPDLVTSDSIVMIVGNDDYEVDLVKSGDDLIYKSRNFRG